MAAKKKDAHQYFFSTVLGFLLHIIMYVRCVCLQDVLSFYYSDTACGFYKSNFTSTFIDSHAYNGCLSDCSIQYTRPKLSKMNGEQKYEIGYIAIIFSQYSFKRTLWKEYVCDSNRTNVYVRLTCRGNYIYEKNNSDQGSCIDHDQCLNVSTSQRFTCDTTDFQRPMWRLKTCLPARGLNETCIKSEQCKRSNPNSTCELSTRRCQCQQGFIHRFNSCLPAPKLGESCDESDQCSLGNEHSTCNLTSGVCQCTGGFLKVLNTCIKSHLLLEEMCDSYLQPGVDIQADIENVCSGLSTISSNLSGETAKNDNIGVIVGVGLAGLLGIVICAVVFFIITRRLKESQNRSERIILEDRCKEKHPQKVQVPEVGNSGNIRAKTRTDDTEETGIYNHLHETPVDLHMHVNENDQLEYDHCTPLAVNGVDDMYSHLDSDNNKSGQYLGDYGEIN